MTRTTEIPTERRLPTRKDAFVFRGKTALLQFRRAVANRFDREIGVYAFRSHLAEAPVISVSRTPLWTETQAEEKFLVAGKIHNLRIAARRLDGVEIPAGETFSFWKQVGRTSRMRGFVVGRELREGCIIPNVGGGLCQLSNALYDAALRANFEIVERHAHTQVIAGSLAEKGRDATVFWNYVDLRFRSDQAFRIEASLDGTDLTVRFRGAKTPAKKLHSINRAVLHSDNPNSCATCEEGDCHRVVAKKDDGHFGQTAFLVDEVSPEFDAYVSGIAEPRDQLMIPLDGRRLGKANYNWTTAGFNSVHQSILTTAKRSYRSRKLAAQGAARQQNLLRMYEELAESYARRLTFDTLHVVVHQNLLPYLWRSGDLGGRTFDVLMTALPMGEIQTQLDHAASLHPESTTLGDFRAGRSLIALEAEALAHAGKLITPHSEIASLFDGRSQLLSWRQPQASVWRKPANPKPRIVFPASTVGRKGCYELREAVRGLDATLVLLGPIIEDADFWDGIDFEKGGDDWLAAADLVVLPAFVEHRPRRLLLAAASGVPVIASNACGTANVAGIQHVGPGDASALRTAIESSLSQTS